MEKSGSGYVVRGIPGKLASFVEHHWGIRDLTRYAQAAPESRSRQVLAEIAGDSKALPSRPFDGIFVRSFGNCFLRDQPLGATPHGSTLLISLRELPHLRILTQNIIGIENVECIFKFEKARKHFPNLDGAEYTLVLRWHWGAAWRDWISRWNGTLLYLPDYDPRGLSIFASEVRPYHSDARVLIPKNFESLLHEHGSRSLYVKQEMYMPTIDGNNELAELCRLLRESRRAIEQEVLLS